MSRSPALTMDEWLATLADEVARSDADFQLRQRQAWREAVGGHPLMEDLDHARHLAVREVRMSLLLAEHHDGWLARLWHRVRGAADGTPRYRMVSEAEAPAMRAVRLEIAIARGQDAAWHASVEPPDALRALEGVDVAGA